ncbi:11-beta-hydroxysteroid dehydrogenase 1B, partial [Mucuna pruriens]
EIAYEYARRGAKLSLVDIRKEKLEAVADKARSLGSPDVTIIAADVSKPQHCKRFVDRTVDYFGRCIGKPEEVENWRDVSDFTPVMDINFWGAVYGTLYAIPHLKVNKGRIIVIASGCGWFPIPKISIYNASKAAVINFFETLRMEIGCDIAITIATPGLIKTDLTLRAMKYYEASLGIFPMGSACECGRAIVESACKGDMYVINPSWVKVLFPWKVLYPELVDWASRLVFGLSQNSSSNKAHLHLSRIPELKVK